MIRLRIQRKLKIGLTARLIKCTGKFNEEQASRTVMNVTFSKMTPHVKFRNSFEYISSTLTGFSDIDGTETLHTHPSNPWNHRLVAGPPCLLR